MSPNHQAKAWSRTHTSKQSLSSLHTSICKKWLDTKTFSRISIPKIIFWYKFDLKVQDIHVNLCIPNTTSSIQITHIRLSFIVLESTFIAFEDILMSSTKHAKHHFLKLRMSTGNFQLEVHDSFIASSSRLWLCCMIFSSSPALVDLRLTEVHHSRARMRQSSHCTHRLRQKEYQFLYRIPRSK